MRCPEYETKCPDPEACLQGASCDHVRYIADKLGPVEEAS